MSAFSKKISRGFIYLKNLKSFDKSIAAELTENYFIQKAQSLILRQKKIPMTFFAKSDDKFSDYDDLSFTFYPINIGAHYAQGSSRIQEFLVNNKEHELWNPINHVIEKIKKNILFLNYYMNTNKLYYLSVGELKEIFHKENNKETSYLSHELFLVYIKEYYINIFHYVEEIDKILFADKYQNISKENKGLLKDAIENIHKSFEKIENYGLHEYDILGKYYISVQHKI